MRGAPMFSIVLCTRNRAHLLRDALDSILAIDYPPQAFELLVVDNDSSDDTAEVARDTQARAPFDVRVVHEAQIGLSCARNRGIRESRGRYLFFTDDDQLVDRDVLRAYERVLERFDVRVVQGAIALSFTGERPAWLHGGLAGFLGETAPLAEGTAVADLFGGNLLLRRDLFDDFGGFDEELGKGRAGYSEDTELARRLRAAGERMIYAPHAKIHHVIRADRATVAFLRQTALEKGRSHARLSLESEPASRLAPAALKHATRHALRAVFYALRGDAHRSADAQSRAAFDAGKVLACADALRAKLRATRRAQA